MSCFAGRTKAGQNLVVRIRDITIVRGSICILAGWSAFIKAGRPERPCLVPCNTHTKYFKLYACHEDWAA